MSKRRVVISGLGAVSPLGLDMPSTWQGALDGRSGIGPITNFDAQLFSCRIAGEVKNFDTGKYFSPKEDKKVDRFAKFAVAAAEEALIDAGVRSTFPYAAEQIGCVLGVGIGGLSVLERNHELCLSQGPRKISPFLIPGMITNMAPGLIAIREGFKGLNFTIQSACASATHALGESYRMIADGRQEMILAGGAEAAITPVGIGGFCAMKAMSTRNEDPSRASRPFDKDRDGFVMGEGAIVLILESLEGARARNAKIYAEVLGYGFSCDAYHMTAPCTDGAGAVQSMRQALADSALLPNQVDYVNAHGTSTPANDKTETLAIKQVFGDHAYDGLLVSSTKSVTGHLLGAAGAIEAAFCSLALRDGVVPPTANFEEPGEGCDLDYVANEARYKPIKVAMSNSFGFGGTNATLILGAVS